MDRIEIVQLIYNADKENLIIQRFNVESDKALLMLQRAGMQITIDILQEKVDNDTNGNVREAESNVRTSS